MLSSWRVIRVVYPKAAPYFRYPFFVEHSQSDALTLRIFLGSRLPMLQKKGTDRSYWEALNHLIEKDSDIMYIMQSSHKQLTEHAESLWSTAPRCGRAHDKYVVKSILISRL